MPLPDLAGSFRQLPSNLFFVKVVDTQGAEEFSSLIPGVVKCSVPMRIPLFAEMLSPHGHTRIWKKEIRFALHQKYGAKFKGS